MKRTAFLFYLAATLFSVALLAIGIELERFNDARHLNAVRNDTQNRLLAIRDRLHNQLTSDIQQVKGLVSVVRLDPDLAQRRFNDIAGPLLAGDTNLRNLALAPDMVISRVFPLAGNEKALGLDYRTVPGQFALANLARQSRQIVVAGPLTLAQGGQGVIVRLPVFLDDKRGQERFWGIISAVIDPEKLFANAGLKSDLTLDIALRGRDGKGAQGTVFLGEPAVFDQHPVLSDIPLPNGSWQLAAVPRGGWPARADTLWLLRAGFFAGALTLIGFCVFMVRSAQQAARAHAEADRARQGLLATLEHAPHVAVQWYDINGRVIYWNPASEHMYGWRAEQALGKTLDQLIFTPEQAAWFADTLKHLAQSGEATLPIDCPVTHRDGHTVWIAAVTFAIPGQMDEQAILVCMDTDITARVETEERLREASLRAEAANVAKSQFLATMSHEIRTPLNGVLGMAQLLLLGGQSAAEQMECARIIINSGKTLLTLLNDILDLSKIEAGKVELERISFAPQELVHETVRLFAELAASKGLALSADAMTLGGQNYLGDPVRIRQMLSNFITNAIKFTHHGSVRIEVIELERDERRALLEIAVVDTGVGIPEAQQAQLFQIFTQADNTITREYGGSGLGLAIVRQLAQLHGGDAGFASTHGQGSRFWFRLAVVPLPAGSERRHAQRPTLSGP